MQACLILTAQKIVLAAGSFSLLWSGAGDARWEEVWNVGLAGFQLAEIRASGEGVTPPEGAARDGDIWRYQPALAMIEDQILIERQPLKGGSWQVCAGGTCRPLPDDPEKPGGTALLKPCP